MNTETFSKVAKITLIFWLMKIVATTLGETFGDFISQTLNLGYYVGLAVTAGIFLVALLLQLNAKKYVPWIFWFVIIGTTTFGTEISDFIDRTLKVGYTGGTIILLSGLAISLLLWYKKYKNLEVYPITERTKEVYFWVAVLFSNSLGTAFGDFLGDSLGLSYFQGAVICGGIILIVVLLHYFTKINHILLFWIAFIFTRPFGATFGDFLTKPLAKGGLDLGTLNASLVSVGIMAVLIFIAHRKHLQEDA
ncbi:COG4705 family protein [Kaistella montana]|uniref:Membrane-anchored protein n=1 Tax=Kaistella montana TaxID=1849733 RepID=A0ABW5KB69_9FLAO|nr:hypothetical protein [Kaistella montana]MCQ4035503.1 hypothetical protein [Kaistella montana]